MIKKTAIFTIIILLISASFIGCSSAPLNHTLTVSNGTESITPYLLLNYAFQYQDFNGLWISADGIGGHQFIIADYAAEFPSIKATDKMSINVPDKTKYSAVKLYNAVYEEIGSVNLSEIASMDPGTYILRLDIETTGRTIGNQTESGADVGFVKIIVGAQND